MKVPRSFGLAALVTSAMPVVTVAPNDALLEKLKSNMQEVRARAGVLYVLADGDTHIESSEGIHVIRMPEHYGPLSPLLHVVPLQLLAYHTACARGTDVDKPRNLAKSGRHPGQVQDLVRNRTHEQGLRSGQALRADGKAAAAQGVGQAHDFCGGVAPHEGVQVPVQGGGLQQLPGWGHGGPAALHQLGLYMHQIHLGVGRER
eukprot:gene15886-33485_t